jgi:hypothetical protein
VIRHDGVTTSSGGEMAPKRGNGEDIVSWTNVNLLLTQKKYMIDSLAINKQ